MASNRYKAMLTLGLATAGFMATYPYSGHFYVGMVHSGCGAALVGGLADWFAVAALFRKPLGFPWRTAVIPRNRERIFNDLVTLVEQELLTEENIMAVVGKYDAAQIVRNYVQAHGGRDNVRAVLVELGQDMLGSINPTEAANFADQLLKDNIHKVKLAPILAQLLGRSLEKNYDAAFIRFVLAKFIDLVETDQFYRLLCGEVEAALKRYENNGLLRSLLDRKSGVAPASLSRKMIAVLTGQLQALQQDNHPTRRALKAWLGENVERLKTDEKMQAALEKWKDDALSAQRQTVLGEQMRQFVAGLQEELRTGNYPPLENYVLQAIDAFVAGLDDDEQRASLDAWAKKMLLRFVEQRQDDIGGLVRQYLDALTNEKLAAFIEERVGDDLQMIRINGSVVGGLVGMGLYLLTAWAERML